MTDDLIARLAKIDKGTCNEVLAGMLDIRELVEKLQAQEAEIIQLRDFIEQSARAWVDANKRQSARITKLEAAYLEVAYRDARNDDMLRNGVDCIERDMLYRQRASDALERIRNAK